MLRNKTGQALIEALIALPLIASMGAAMLWFLYWSSYNEIIHLALFRASRCEASIDSTRCLEKLRTKVSKANILSSAQISRRRQNHSFTVKTKIRNHTLIQKLKGSP